MEVAMLLVSLLASIIFIPCFIVFIHFLITFLKLRDDHHANHSLIHARTHFTLPPMSLNQNHMHLYQSGTLDKDGRVCDLKLSVVKYEGHQVDREEVVCVFCLSQVKEGAEIREITCHHVFHKACLDVWLESWGDTCPLCRVSVVVPPRTKKKKIEGVVDDDEENGRSVLSWVSHVPSSWWI